MAKNWEYIPPKSLNLSAHELDSIACGLPPVKPVELKFISWSEARKQIDEFMQSLAKENLVVPKCTVTGDIEKQTMTATFTYPPEERIILNFGETT